MRLLNVKTLDFEEFIGELGDGIPSYAILSHTWGAEEVSYSDYIDKKSLSKKGYDKIHGCCRLADSEGFQYVWIDTCCIDKSSSAELSEAINSMFQWYRDAGICYAYLKDVDSDQDPTIEESSFTRSNWFTRGWTLQELLAPAEVVFLGSDWTEIGTKKTLRGTVSRITRISMAVLDECQWTEYSVAQKMSWAAGRRTTRLEDEAYCLMGLFDVNMPLLYGEGRKAFSRLQQEILKQSDDQSIFAWSYPEEEQGHTEVSGLIARSPEYFRDASGIELLGREHGEDYENPFQIVNQFVRVTLRLLDNVKAIKLKRLLEKPPFYNIVEIQRGQEISEGRQSKPSSRLDSQREEIADEKRPLVEIPQLLFTPIISIEAPDGSTTTQPLEEGSGVYSSYLNKTVEDSGVNSGSRLNEAAVELGLKREDCDLNVEKYALMSPESWRWYIYEPAIILPLRCHIRGYQLGILLSKGSIATEGKVLWRLHDPSIVSTKAVRASQLTPLTTVHASLSTRTQNRSNSVRDLDRLRWPEIRIVSLLSAGYTVHKDCGPGWVIDYERSVVVQKSQFQHEHEMTEYAPLMFFHRSPNNDQPTSAFFVSIPSYKNRGMTCEIGVFLVTSAPFGVLDYNLYSFDLARERRAEVSLQDGQAVVAKYREGAGVSFVNVSIETLSRDMAADLVPHDKAKTGWLSSKLFPRLRSLR